MTNMSISPSYFLGAVIDLNIEMSWKAAAALDMSAVPIYSQHHT
jgi:hypothetical protein